MYSKLFLIAPLLALLPAIRAAFPEDHDAYGVNCGIQGGAPWGLTMWHDQGAYPEEEAEHEDFSQAERGCQNIEDSSAETLAFQGCGQWILHTYQSDDCDEGDRKAEYGPQWVPSRSSSFEIESYKVTRVWGQKKARQFAA